ncbi:hypothetical protein BGZ65_007719 [Modicella reniformis]|uniref:Uncharacterized protein n=1 Tax=Modicella reniformis TaxID=1440133 RepID=A0A9P6LXK9_9FUNG|nr:hypothetical protein BGZ65_007719 [Modicella reniformis]
MEVDATADVDGDLKMAVGDPKQTRQEQQQQQQQQQQQEEGQEGQLEQLEQQHQQQQREKHSKCKDGDVVGVAQDVDREASNVREIIEGGKV